MTETKRFSTEAVVATHGGLLICSIGDIYEVVNWVLDTSISTVGLLAARAEYCAALVEQHPWLSDVVNPEAPLGDDRVTEEQVFAFIAELHRAHGATVELTRASAPREATHLDDALSVVSAEKLIVVDPTDPASLDEAMKIIEQAQLLTDEGEIRALMTNIYGAEQSYTIPEIDSVWWEKGERHDYHRVISISISNGIPVVLTQNLTSYPGQVTFALSWFGNHLTLLDPEKGELVTTAEAADYEPYSLMINESGVQFEKLVLTKIEEKPGQGWYVSADSLGFYLPRLYEDQAVPVEGDRITLYAVLGSQVVGIVHNGRVIFYQDAAAREVRRQKWLADYKAESAARFERDRVRLDAQYEALPELFRARLDRFRAEDPDFRRTSEIYESFILAQAALLAKHFETVQRLEEFHALDYDAQMELGIEGWAGEEHSGNTYGCSIVFAKALIQNIPV